LKTLCNCSRTFTLLCANCLSFALCLPVFFPVAVILIPFLSYLTLQSKRQASLWNSISIEKRSPGAHPVSVVEKNLSLVDKIACELTRDIHTDFILPFAISVEGHTKTATLL